MGVLQPSLSDTVSSFGSGIYVLAAELKRSSRLEIGGLGRHSFPKGFYLYVGSAQRNLAHRLRRHLSEHPNGKKLHWHIDYLLAHARVRYIWGFAGPKDWECRLSRYLTGLDGVQIPLNGFGSSDCNCKTHLYYFPTVSESRVLKKFPNTPCHSERTPYRNGTRRSEESSILEICASGASAFGVTSVVSLPQNDNYAILFRSLEAVIRKISPNEIQSFYCELERGF